MEVRSAGAVAGRRDDLARLRQLLRGGGALLHGPAGIGKSVLLRRFAELAGEDGAVARIEGNESSGLVPLGPFSALLSLDELPVDRDPVRTAAAVRHRLEGVRLLAVDDAHRLDAASAGLVHRLAGDGVPLLLAVRDGEDVPPAIASLWSRGTVVPHRVAPFTESETAEFAAQRLGPPVDAGLVRALHAISAGNPLFARELLLGAVEAGAVVRFRGVWVLRGELPASGIAAVLRRRLAAQPAAVRRAVELVAAAEPLPTALLAPIADEADLRLAEDAGLLRRETEPVPVTRLGHPLYRAAALDGASRARRAGIAADLLAAAEAAGSGLVDPARLAAWRLERGEKRPPREWLEAAARVQPTDQPLAEAFLRAAVDAGGGPAAMLALASLLTHQHRIEEGAEVFAALDGLELPSAARIQVVAAQAFLLAMPAHRPDEALALLDATERRCGASLELDSARALALWCSGRIDEAIELGRPIVASDASVPARASAAMTVVSANLYGARAEAGDADFVAANRLVPLAAVEMPETPAALGLVTASVESMQLRDLAAALEVTEAGYRRSLLDGDDGVRAQYALMRGWALALGGDLEGAVSSLREAYAGRGVWVPTTAPWLRSALVRVLVAAGDLAGAREVLGELEADAVSGLYAADAALARASVLAAAGEVGAALALLRAAGEEADRLGGRLRGDEIVFERLRLGDRGIAEEAVRRARRRGGPVGAAIAAAAEAVAREDRAGVERPASGHAAAGMLWAACEAQAAAVRAHRAAGDELSERIAVERLADLAGRCRGLAVEGVLAELRPRLTPREREIALLAADESDRAIAARLGISERTVQTHLSRAYRKLRIAGRAQLRSALPAEG